MCTPRKCASNAAGSSGWVYRTTSLTVIPARYPSQPATSDVARGQADSAMRSRWPGSLRGRPTPARGCARSLAGLGDHAHPRVARPSDLVTGHTSILASAAPQPRRGADRCAANRQYDQRHRVSAAVRSRFRPAAGEEAGHGLLADAGVMRAGRSPLRRSAASGCLGGHETKCVNDPRHSRRSRRPGRWHTGVMAVLPGAGHPAPATNGISSAPRVPGPARKPGATPTANPAPLAV